MIANECAAADWCAMRSHYAVYKNKQNKKSDSKYIAISQCGEKARVSCGMIERVSIRFYCAFVGFDLISFLLFLHLHSDIFRLRECDENGGANYPVKKYGTYRSVWPIPLLIRSPKQCEIKKHFQSHFKECEIETKGSFISLLCTHRFARFYFIARLERYTHIRMITIHRWNHPFELSKCFNRVHNERRMSAFLIAEYCTNNTETLSLSAFWSMRSFYCYNHVKAGFFLSLCVAVAVAVDVTRQTFSPLSISQIQSPNGSNAILPFSVYT